MIAPTTARPAVDLLAADLPQGAAAPASRRRAAAGNGLSGGASAAAVVHAALLGTPQRMPRAASIRRNRLQVRVSTGYAKKPLTSERAAGTASSKTASSKGATSKNDPLSFLKDRKLSVEEKLIRLLAYLNEKWDKEMHAKMDEIAAGENGSASGASGSSRTPGSGYASGSGAASSSGVATSSPPPSSKKSGGLLGGVADMVKGAFGGSFGGIALDVLKNPASRAMLAKISGPVLAAGACAFGCPALAPVLLKYGPALVEVAGGIASSLDGGGGGESAGAAAGEKRSPVAPSGARRAFGAPAGEEKGIESATGEKKATGATSGKKMSDSERQRLTLEIQRIYEKQKEMFSLVSNILRTCHDTRMAVVNNVR